MERKLLSRREFLSAAGLALGGAALAACAPATPAPEEKPEVAEAPPEPEAVEITFWQHYGGESRPAQTNKLIEEYKGVAPNVTVTYETIPIVDYDKKLTSTLAAGSGSDMFAIGDWNFALYTSKNWLAAADPASFGVADIGEMIDLYLPGSLGGVVLDDQLYGIPNEYNVLHTYWWKDDMEEAGLDPDVAPATWEECGEVGDKLTVRDASGNITRAGLQWAYRPPMSTEWPVKCFHPLIYQLGGDILSEDGTECTMNSPEGEHACEFYLDLVEKYKCSEPGFTIAEINQEFWEHRSSIWFQGPWGVGGWRSVDPDTVARWPEGWGIANFPKWSEEYHKRDMSPMWRWCYVVNRNSPNAQVAWKFIDFLSQDQIGWLTTVGDIPARKGWEDDPATEDLPWLEIQLKDFPNGVPVPQTPKYQELADLVSQALEHIISDRGNIKQHLDKAKEDIDAMLKEA